MGSQIKVHGWMRHAGPFALFQHEAVCADRAVISGGQHVKFDPVLPSAQPTGSVPKWDLQLQLLSAE
eukprot:3588515-Amphidinium_carterae.1